MKIENPQNRTLEEVLVGISAKYPGSEIKKPFLTPRSILAPYEDFKFLVRDRKTFFKIDFVPPVIWIIGGIIISFVIASVVLSIIYGQLVFGIGGALWIILGILLVKYIFKSRNKLKFDTFYADVQNAVNRNSTSSVL